MPKKDKDECIKVFLTELKNQKLAGHDGITCHPSMLEEDSKLKFSLGYIISSGPAWATQEDLLNRQSEKKKKEEFFKKNQPLGKLWHICMIGWYIVIVITCLPAV